MDLTKNNPQTLSNQGPVTGYYDKLPRTFTRHVRRHKNGCWIWKGAAGFHPNHRQHRYGQLKYWDAAQNKRICTSAHRFAYMLVFGPVAPELDVDHLCNNKLCVNPSHLEAITHQENCIRRSQRSA